VATSVGLPFEVYDLVHKVSTIGALLFAINLALVLYLVITKRLFGLRGGKRAYEARLRSESIMDAAIKAAPADHGDDGDQGDDAEQGDDGERRQIPELPEVPAGRPDPAQAAPDRRR
jgi:hypothetical protein